MKFKKNLILFFWLLAAIILGGLAASLCEQVPFLSWLSYAKTIGIDPNNPFLLDFSVVRLAFGLEIGISVAQVIAIILSFFGYKATVRRLN